MLVKTNPFDLNNDPFAGAMRTLLKDKGESFAPVPNRPGFYAGKGFVAMNSSHMLPKDTGHYPDMNGIFPYGSPYGVCDTVEQFIARYEDCLENDDRKLVVSFCIIDKEPENKGQGGGWRWHKWGPYIGDKNPQCEYLDDEGDDITQAVCYHVHQLPEEWV